MGWVPSTLSTIIFMGSGVMRVTGIAIRETANMKTIDHPYGLISPSNLCFILGCSDFFGFYPAFTLHQIASASLGACLWRILHRRVFVPQLGPPQKPIL